MDKTLIKVPPGIKYISEWTEYELPRGSHCIVDKGVTGCGYTEFALSNDDWVVLCSPRKLLLENKRDQHTKDTNILYLENGISNFQDTKAFKDLISSHILECQFSKRPAKFMITYDSLHYLVDTLQDQGLLEKFIFVVDEFQSVFNDSFFKAEVEIDFVQVLQVCQNVIYLSATPMLDRYLEVLDEFKDLPFYRLDWSETGYVENIKIQRKRVKRLAGEVDKIIDRYLEGKFETLFDNYGKVVESKEVVFYFNSVTEIVSAINRHQIPDPNNPGEKIRLLNPQNTLIICADTPENQRKLKRIGFTIGRVPLEGEENPEFMFCTATTYVGIDMHSSCASSFIFADPNIESLALDISLDLPQIVGRQRNRENPFKNNITIFYKTTYKEITREEFDEKQKQRKESTTILLDTFSSMNDKAKKEYLGKLKDGITVSKYSGDFVSISKIDNSPIYNRLIEVADERSWEISQRDYQDSIAVTRAIQGAGYNDQEEYFSDEEKFAQDFLDNHFYATGQFTEKMKMYCDFVDAYGGNQDIMNIINHKITDPSFEKYYKFYGTKGCSAKLYRKNELEIGILNYSKDDLLEKEICKTFKEGERYAKSDIKQILENIYSSLGINKKAKATDLESYFKLSKTCITMPDKTTKNGFKLSSK